MTPEEAIKILKDGSTAFNDVEAKAFCEAYDIAIKALEEQPKTGHWYYDEERGATGIYAICSNCEENIYQTGDFKYCPNCGAKMAESEG